MLVLVTSKVANAEPSQDGSVSSNGEPTVGSFDVFQGTSERMEMIFVPAQMLEPESR